MDLLIVAGMRARAAAMGLLYRKMQRLRSLKDKKIGEVCVCVCVCVCDCTCLLRWEGYWSVGG